MLKRLLLAGVAGALVMGGVLVTASLGQAQDKKLVFAVVPKALNNPFYDQAKAGCEKAAAELGNVQCFFTGPGEHGGGDEQAQIVADLVAKGVDGIAVSPSNAAAMAAALKDAKAAKIPVLTFDSDLLPDDAGERIAYVGTHNYEIGSNLAKLVMKAKPKGGTVCIQSGGAAAANHKERMQGIRDTLGGKSNTQPPGDRLTGQNGWTEVDGCPLYTNDDFPLSVQQEEDILNKYPDLDSFIATGGFAQFLPDANASMLQPFKDRISSGKLALAVADTLPMQIDALKAGLATGNVGQRPFEMGYKSIMFLKDIHDGKPAPKDPTYTGLDVCTPETANTCVGGGG
jgi:ribose transport system substrate-binding protein